MNILGDLIELLLEVVWDKVIIPVFQYLGSVFVWLMFLGQKKYSEIKDRNYNAFLGFVILFILIISFSWILK